jgi:glucose/arabinose dehydrogenase
MRINMVTGIHGVQEITFNPLAKPGDEDYGLLYIGVGDGGSVGRGYAHLTQSREKIWGTILLIDPRGDNSANGKYGIPVGNPWDNIPDNKILKEVYAFGFRNPHRITWSQSGLMLASNIGQKNIDALYQVQPGGNHGWPIREGTFMINPADVNKVYPLPPDDHLYELVYPIAQYDHDEGTAISGGYEYAGTKIPELRGKYLFGDITNGRLFYINLNEVQLGQQAKIREWQVSFKGQVISLEDLCKDKRVDLRFGRDALGELYLFTKPDGKIYQCVNTS